MKVNNPYILTSILALPLLLFSLNASADNVRRGYYNQSPHNYGGHGHSGYKHGSSHSKHRISTYPHGYSNYPKANPHYKGNTYYNPGYRTGNVYIYPNTSLTQGYRGISRHPHTYFNTHSPSSIYYNRHGSGNYGYNQGYVDGYKDAQKHYKYRQNN